MLWRYSNVFTWKPLRNLHKSKIIHCIWIFLLQRRYPVYSYEENRNRMLSFDSFKVFFSHSSNFPLQWLVWLVEWQRRINFVLKWRQSALNFDCKLTELSQGENGSLLRQDLQTERHPPLSHTSDWPQGACEHLRWVLFKSGNLK